MNKVNDKEEEKISADKFKQNRQGWVKRQWAKVKDRLDKGIVCETIEVTEEND